MNKIRFLIGIGFLIITASILIGNNQKCTNLSNTNIKDGDSTIVRSPKISAINTYKLDFNITWGGSGTNYGSDIVLDDSGNIYIIGTTNSKGAGGRDAFVAKYDNTGKLLLNFTWGYSGQESGSSIALDSSGNIYIVGTTSSKGAGGDDAFIAKFNSTGKSKFNITWGGSSTDSGSGIALDSSGNIYIVGTTSSKGAGGEDAFVAKFNSTKNSEFNITWGGSYEDEGSDIALDDSGNIYIVGTTSSKGAGGKDAFVAKFNSTKNSEFNITWGGSYDEVGSSITLEGSDNIYITGTNTTNGANSYDVFAAKFNSNSGKSLLNITWCGNYPDYGSDIALDNLGNIYIVGRTVSISGGYLDTFVAKYDSIGKSLLNITYNISYYDDFGSGIALDGSGNIYITGYTDYSNMGDWDAFITKYSIVYYQGYIPPSDDDDDDNDDKVSPIVISGYNLFFLVGFLGLSIVFLIKKRLK